MENTQIYDVYFFSFLYWHRPKSGQQKEAVFWIKYSK